MKSCLIINALFSSLVLLLCLTTTLRVPLRQVYWWILAIVLFLLVVEARRHFSLRVRLQSALGILAAGMAIVGAVGLLSFQGCFPSVSNDAWSYASLGRYLIDYGRGTNGALPYIDRYSAALSGTRFGTPSLLGFLSLVFHINTGRALLPVLLIVLVNGLLGFYLLTRLLGAGKITALGSGIFFVLCGWTSDAIAVGSLDNLLLLSLSGAIIARLLLIVRGCRSWPALAALTINSAALFYSYPEGFLLISVIFSPFAFQVVFRAFKINRRLPLRLAGVLLAAFVLVAPYLPTWMTFFSTEMSAINSQSRPGAGLFPGLLGPSFISALLGSGTEFSLASVTAAAEVRSLILAGGATFFCLAGLSRLKSWRIAGASALFIALGFALLQRVYLKYDYGLYKVLLLSSLVWVPAMFVGVDGIVRNFQPKIRSFAAVASCLLLQSIFLFERFQNRDAIPFIAKKIKSYEQIQGLGKIVQNQAVALACNHDFECEWALYYARQLNVQVLGYKGYLKAYKPVIAQSHDNDQVAAYILSDYPVPNSIWHNRTFWLTGLGSGVLLVSIDSPNGFESWDGKRFLWIGDQLTRFLIYSGKECRVMLKSEAILMGPSIRRSDYRMLCVKSDDAVRDLEVSKCFNVLLQLHRGMNEVEVWCKDKPEILRQPNGDRRILLVGLLNYQVEEVQGP